jgi:cytochrome c oxidase assembly factor CtaG
MIPLPLIPTFADTLPPLRAGQLGATEFDVVPILMILGAALLYVWGVMRIHRLRPRHRWSGWRTAAFFSALVVTAFSIFSFIGVYDGVLFWDHMVQHLLLIMVASALFAMASPIDLAWRATTGRAHEAVTTALRSGVARFFGHPAVAFVLYAVVIPVSHLTAFYNYTLQREEVHNLEHVLFLVVGYLFWRQIFGAEPNRYRMHPAMQLGYLFLAVPVDTFTGLSLTQVRHEIFPAYVAVHRTWGPSLVTDLHLGGVIMWVGGDTLMLLPMIPIAIRWMRMEERRAVRVDRELDAMLPTDRDLGPGAPSERAGPEGART